VIPVFDQNPPAAPLAWSGPGLTAFVGKAEGAEPSEPLLRLEAVDGLARMLGAADSSELPSAVRAFFEAGGRECLVAARGCPRSGDGGIDWRGAVNALADTEEAGTIVLLGAAAQGARERALQLADRRLDLFWILEGRGGERAGSTSPPRTFSPGAGTEGGADVSPDGPAVLYLRGNAALVRPTRESPRGAALAATLGDLAGALEAADFALEPRFPSRRGGMPPWLAEPDRRYLEWWRRCEGLRRSLDLGTRWLFLEPDGPFLRRRVERDVAAFLRRLAAHGLLENAGEAFEVECAPLPGGAPARLAVRVRASVRVPRGAARRGTAVESPVAAEQAE
jgi:hypothetical protein